ncbi:GDYXXLXY domain-containing protein [Campylobacter blaseri]|uniref:Membrane-anchored protein n=1 Tax=Campylobacter blaseri TaxID=2042961 RepID=A0A2P8R0A5_9BACT|nr:GDYXXLXY domain-containing protein [Campylobacter blaseri]PSM51919.1 hypothetical protein CQ405_04965 [Campylobacter blaseri]PSM53703.1 hypothetical protein CRN67_04965 [Campylobacter blaseri]QKF85743.1 GDYXXLXY domain-containing protein [Campylobacter blaseri]
MKKMVLIGISFQILVLFSFIFFAYAPLYFGNEVKVRATGFDPRDIFLGNYVRLDYPDIKDVNFDEKVDVGRKVYVVLEKNGDLYKGKFVTKQRPKDEVYLSGRTSGGILQNGIRIRLDLKFGIEKYYLPRQKALDMEKDLRDAEAIVTLGVLKGFARIKKVELQKNN